MCRCFGSREAFRHLNLILRRFSSLVNKHIRIISCFERLLLTLCNKNKSRSARWSGHNEKGIISITIPPLSTTPPLSKETRKERKTTKRVGETTRESQGYIMVYTGYLNLARRIEGKKWDHAFEGVGCRRGRLRIRLVSLSSLFPFPSSHPPVSLVRNRKHTHTHTHTITKRRLDSPITTVSSHECKISSRRF